MSSKCLCDKNVWGIDALQCNADSVEETFRLPGIVWEKETTVSLKRRMGNEAQL